MFIIISGGSVTAEFLVNMMLEQHHRIVIIEEDRETLEHLSDVLDPQVLIVEGDGTDSSVLLDAGADEADLFVALMGHDDTNLVACEIAMTAFHVPRCIANVNSPKNIRIFREVGIEPVSSTEIIAQMVEEEAVLGDMRMVFSLREGNIVMVREQVSRDVGDGGVRVADVGLGETARIIAVERDGDSVMVAPDTVLLAGETVVAAVKSGHEEGFCKTVRSLR